MASLPGIPQTDARAATRSALEGPLYELGLKHAPDEVLRELQSVVLDVRKRWPEERRPQPAGVSSLDQPPPTKFVPAEREIEAAGDALAEAIACEVARQEGPLQHKSVMMHLIIVQAINASFRRFGAMSPQGYVDGIANGVAQMLAIANADSMFALFNETFPKVFAHWRRAGLGAGVDYSKPMGRS